MFFLIRCTPLLMVAFTPGPWNAFQASHDERVLGRPEISVVDRFRRNLLTTEETAQVQTLIEQLGHDNFRVREKALQELHYWKPGAEALLRRAAFDDNLERARRAEKIAGHGLGRWSPIQAEAAVRLLKKTPTPEATKILLEYQPFAMDIGVELEIASTLRAFAEFDELAAMIRTAKASLHPAVFDANLPDPSPTLAAGDLARRFFALVAQGDIDGLAQATQLPFALGNGVVLTSPDQRDDFFRQAIINYRDANAKSTLTFMHVSRGDDYLRFASADETEFLRDVPPHELRAVHVRVRRDWRQQENGIVLIRVGEKSAHVIGLAK